jgi:hypothetical protein
MKTKIKESLNLMERELLRPGSNERFKIASRKELGKDYI